MNLRKLILVVFALVCTNTIFSQSDKYLKSKLKYCNVEVTRLEGELEKYEQLLSLQTTAVQDLKTQVQDKDQEIEILKKEKFELEQIAVNIVNVALKLEKEGNMQGAMEVYKILIKSYPTSLEAAASRIRIQNYTSELEGYDK